MDRRNSYLTLLLIFLCATNVLSAVDFDSSLGANLAYYLDDKKGGSGNQGGFLPPRYEPQSYADRAA